MSDNKPIISVIIPVYNCERTITTCLKSILSQSIKNIEVIVIDDGSTDHTCSIIEKQLLTDKRIVLEKQTNQGPSSARNRGIELARGGYISFVDGDDEVYPGMFETLLNYQKEYDVELIISGIRKKIKEKKKTVYTDINVKGKQLFSNKKEIQDSFIQILRMGLNSPVGRIYKMNIIRKHKIMFRERLDIGEDLQFNLDYIDKINRLLFIPEIFYQYNTEFSTLTGRYRSNLFDVRKRSILLLKEFLEKNAIPQDIIYYLYLKLVYAVSMQEIDQKSPLAKRILLINKILERPEIKYALQQYKPKSLEEKLLYIILKLRCPYIIDVVSWLFLQIRKRGTYYIHRISV